MPITKWDQLKIAIHKGELVQVKALIKEPEVDIKGQGEGGITLLHIAVLQKASREIFKILISESKKKNISLDILDSSEKTPLDYAFASANIIAIELLIKAGADYQRKRFKILEETCLGAFLEKNPAEREKVEGFIAERLKHPQLAEAETLYQEEPEEPASNLSQRLQAAETDAEKSCAPSSERNSFFNMISGLFNQFRGYIKVPTDDIVGNKEKAFKKNSGNHPKTD